MTTRWHKLLYILLFFIYSYSYKARAALINVTIDDQYGDEMTGVVPWYLPLSNWTQGATCVGCFAKPDPNLALSGTWHDTTWHPNVDQGAPFSINIIFNGKYYTTPFIHLCLSDMQLNRFCHLCILHIGKLCSRRHYRN